MAIENIRFIMINTSHPGNIGAAARVMKNMGLSRLYLVAPKRYPAPEATAMASGADDLLEQAIVCDTLEEALEGCHLVLGSTARERKIQHEFLDARAAGELVQEEAVTQQVALVFGRERTGLTNEETGLCHKLINIPTNPDYSSLNVASAIQIAAYEIMMAGCSIKTEHDGQVIWTDRTVDYASSDAMEGFYDHLEQTLIDIEFLNPQQSPQLMPKLRQLYNRSRLKQEELNILRGILTSTQKSLPGRIHGVFSKKHGR